MADCVLFEEISAACGRRFGHATLNSSATLNTLSPVMIDRLGPMLTQWSNDPSIAGVVLDAVGDKAFCAGGNLQLLYASMKETPQGQDRNPRWQPATLAEVSESYVQSFLQPPHPLSDLI